MKEKKILILVCFCWFRAAIFLRKNNYDVTLISDRDFFYIYPTSIWIPTGEATMEDVSIPLQDLANAHKFELIVDKVESINAQEKIVKTANDEFKAEYLIVAIGMVRCSIKEVRISIDLW